MSGGSLLTRYVQICASVVLVRPSLRKRRYRLYMTSRLDDEVGQPRRMLDMD